MAWTANSPSAAGRRTRARPRDASAAAAETNAAPAEQRATEAEAAARSGATRYCMVMSGRGPTVAGTKRLAEIVRRTGWPSLGVVPWFDAAWRLPAVPWRCCCVSR